MQPMRLFARLLVTAAAATFSIAGFPDEIKLGYNGDLSASPSAQSGQAAVIGIEAAISDINSAGGLLGRKLVLTLAHTE